MSWGSKGGSTELFAGGARGEEVDEAGVPYARASLVLSRRVEGLRKKASFVETRKPSRWHPPHDIQSFPVVASVPFEALARKKYLSPARKIGIHGVAGDERDRRADDLRVID